MQQIKHSLENNITLNINRSVTCVNTINNLGVHVNVEYVVQDAKEIMWHGRLCKICMNCILNIVLCSLFCVNNIQL